MTESKSESDAKLKIIEPKTIEADDLIPIAKQISKLFGKAFWHSDDPAKHWPVSSIMRRLQKLALVILAFDQSESTLIGYALFDKFVWGKHHILFVDSESVLDKMPGDAQDRQHRGIGTKMLKEGLRQLPSDIVSARTQNPAIAHMLEKLKPSKILPLDSLYSDDNIEILKALESQAAGLKGTDIDLLTGISKRVYKEGKLGDYVINMEHDYIRQFEERIKELDSTWDRDAGDAVILTAIGIQTNS